MKPRTRDNFIYLAVGLGLVVLLAADFIYSESNHTRMWMPSRFVFRATTTLLLLAYFVIREMRREKGRPLQTFAAVLFAMLAQLGVMFGFRQIVEELPGISYCALAVVEMFVVWQLSVRSVFYLISPRRAH